MIPHSRNASHGSMSTGAFPIYSCGSKLLGESLIEMIFDQYVARSFILKRPFDAEAKIRFVNS